MARPSPSPCSLPRQASLIGPDPQWWNDGMKLCTVVTAPVARVGLGPYMWLVETNTAVASACLGKQCATTFNGPQGLAASFNRSLWYAKGHVISSEMRAFSNAGGCRFAPHSGALIGITGYGPNINLAAHPLFGRNSELPGEDPFLSGEYAVQVISIRFCFLGLVFESFLSLFCLFLRCLSFIVDFFKNCFKFNF